MKGDDMTNSDLIAEAREYLDRECNVSEWPNLVSRLADALDEAREVLAGADHTAAKYWRRMTEAERDVRELQAHRDVLIERRDEWLHRAHAAERERDEVAAVIQRARRRPPERTATTDSVYDTLSAVPADVLRERDAERWDEAIRATTGMLDNQQIEWLTTEGNPYRETKEQD